MRQPIYYTTIEGGNWLKFPIDISIGKRNLYTTDSLTFNYTPTIMFPKRLKVHSLLFENIYGYLIRWDCINGWTNLVLRLTKRDIH